MKPKSVDYSSEKFSNKNKENKDNKMVGKGKLLLEKLEHVCILRRRIRREKRETISNK